MKYALWMVLLCPLANAAPCLTSQAKDGTALIQIEQTWDDPWSNAILPLSLAFWPRSSKMPDRMANSPTALLRLQRRQSTERCITNSQIYSRTCKAISDTSGAWPRQSTPRVRL